MQEILSNINKTKGVIGSMLVDKDGILVASDVTEAVNKDTVCAVASSIVSTTEKVLTKMKHSKFNSFIIAGNQGRLAVMDAGRSFLIVSIEKDCNVGLIMVELKDAAQKVREKLKL